MRVVAGTTIPPAGGAGFTGGGAGLTGGGVSAVSADEVVVPVEVRVVAGDGVVEHELLDEAALLQRVQDVVDRGPRRGRHGAIDGGPDLLGRWMPRRREQVLEHGHALLRDPQALLPQAARKHGVCVHYQLRLSLD